MSFDSVASAQEVLLQALDVAAAAVKAAQPGSGLQVLAELGEVVDPPAVVLLPPTLTWEGPGPAPRTGVWTVALVVAAGKGDAAAELLALLPAVVTAIEETVECVLQTAEPDIFRTGSTELPAYFLRVEVAL